MDGTLPVSENLGGRFEAQRGVDHLLAAAARLGTDRLRVGVCGIELLSIPEMRVDAAAGGEPVVDIFDEDQRTLVGAVVCMAGHERPRGRNEGWGNANGG